jgi:hypothetical protein
LADQESSIWIVKVFPVYRIRKHAFGSSLGHIANPTGISGRYLNHPVAKIGAWPAIVNQIHKYDLRDMCGPIQAEVVVIALSIFQDRDASDTVTSPQIAAAKDFAVQQIQEVPQVHAGLQWIKADREVIPLDRLFHR